MKTAGRFEAALLVKNEQLIEVVAELTSHSATMKAWFALRLKTKGKSSKPPEWAFIWSLIQRHGTAWTALYKKGSFHTSQWEIQEPASKLDLWAYTLCVLYCNVQDNPNGDEERVNGIKWHEYYYESEGKYFLLFTLLKYLTPALNSGQSTSIFRPKNTKVVPYWLETCGGRIGEAAQMFMDGE